MDSEEYQEHEEEQGSDELLSADDLRLPESANVLVRLHALRAWLNRRSSEAEMEIGLAALDLQQIMSLSTSEARPRRRNIEEDSAQQRAQRSLNVAQQRRNAYEEAQNLLEDCVAHVTTGERLLVEYYLALTDRIQSPDSPTATPWTEVMADVQQRVEQIGTPGEEDE